VHIVDESYVRVRRLLTYCVDKETRRSIRVLAIEGCVAAREEAWSDHPQCPDIWDGFQLYDNLEEIIWVFNDGATKEEADSTREDIVRHMNMFKNSPNVTSPQSRKCGIYPQSR
jgi:hypothetical protein